jgi:hypothetical protein
VRRSGAYALSGRKITLKQAIISAAPEDVPKDARVELIHRIGANKQEIINVSLDELMSGKVEDETLRPNDIIRVGPQPRAATRPAATRAD